MENGWIKVEDRLPEKDGEYIIGFDFYSSKPYHQVAWFLQGEWHFFCTGPTEDRLLYWMPLPKPPTE